MKQFLLLGGLQGIIIALALFRIAQPVNKKSNIAFGVLILIVSSYLLIQSQIEYFSLYPKFFLTAYVLIHLYCPTFYIYILLLSKERVKWSKVHLFMFAPAVIFLLFLARYFIMPNSEVMDVLRNEALTDLAISDFVAICVNTCLLIISWKIIKKRRSKNLITKSEFRVLAWFVFSIGLSNLMWMGLLGPYIGIFSEAPFNPSLVYIVMSGLIFLFAYVLIARNYFFSGQRLESQERYKNVSIKDSQLEVIGKQIVEILEETKAYKSQDFSLANLSELTGVDKFKLSYTISNSLETSFTSLINEYRVNEFISLSTSNSFRHYTMLGIANEAGFKSKSTFYKAFKDIKGITPKEYLDRLNEDVKTNQLAAVD